MKNSVRVVTRPIIKSGHAAAAAPLLQKPPRHTGGVIVTAKLLAAERITPHILDIDHAVGDTIKALCDDALRIPV
jgi:hypothetical protein